MDELRQRFIPDPGEMPNVVVKFAPLDAYDVLLGIEPTGELA